MALGLWNIRRIEDHDWMLGMSCDYATARHYFDNNYNAKMPGKFELVQVDFESPPWFNDLMTGRQ
jgi:hypothetical protein